MKKSTFLSINVRDISRGFFTAFLTAFITAAIQLLKDGSIPSLKEFATAGTIGLTAGLAYIIKNWLTNSNDQLLTKEVIKS